MQLNSEEYRRYVDSIAPKSKCLKNCVHAFWIGGLICVIGQGFMELYQWLDLPQTACATFTSISLVFLSALLTGLSVYDDIAKHAGAGTLVPITGFANAVVAPAVEFKTEGMILGTAAKMFTIAGPVIVYGVSASVVYGVIDWVTTVFF